MRAVAFGRINVQNHGVPVKMGHSTLNGTVTQADETIVVTSAAPFCQDMCPFKMTLDTETVMVKSIAGGVNFSVQRGIDGTSPSSHISGSGVDAQFKFFGWNIAPVAGLTGKVYWGTKNLVAGGAGVINEFVPRSSTASVGSDLAQFVSPDHNPMMLTDYAMDAAVDGEGLYVTLWVE